MINLLSIRCSLAFAPYIIRAAEEYVSSGVTRARVVRQGGSGLVIGDSPSFGFKHQHRDAYLSSDDAAHYAAAVRFRSEIFDIRRHSDEVIIASVGSDIFLSHPQSDLWLPGETIVALTSAFRKGVEERDISPDWLRHSIAGERLLLSDQRNGRWVLLAEEHISDMEKRLPSILPPRQQPHQQGSQPPPVISIKGMDLHLQFATSVARCLNQFVETGQIDPFAEYASEFRLHVGPATDGMELNDGTTRLAITRKEAKKWLATLKKEMRRLAVKQAERGAIRTVFASVDSGTWILQWGDELFLPSEVEIGQEPPNRQSDAEQRRVRVTRTERFLILLDSHTGATVAVDKGESAMLRGSIDAKP